MKLKTKLAKDMLAERIYDIGSGKEVLPNFLNRDFPVSFHSSYDAVYRKIQRWVQRFPFATDESIYNDLVLFYLLSAKRHLDHRSEAHLFRLVLAIHFTKKKLLKNMTFSPSQRHLSVNWMPTELDFPFSKKSVVGCLVGYSFIDRYEIFDEDNVVLALQKHLPELQLVKGSSYTHNSVHKDLNIFYFEIEKQQGTSFRLDELNLLKNQFEEKAKQSIQQLTPKIFMGLNNEEIYKNTLVLSQEIQSLDDLPQANITLCQQSGKEIVFLVNLVQLSPFHRFALEEKFLDCRFVSEWMLTVSHLNDHPIEAHLFYLHLPREASLLRSDGSLDFHAARKRVVELMQNAIGQFRDYNGGILVKQQEQLIEFKKAFKNISREDCELIETFFYNLIPLEKQVVIMQEILAKMFENFYEHRKNVLENESEYVFNTYCQDGKIYIIVYSNDPTLNQTITELLQNVTGILHNIVYNFVETANGTFFNGVLLNTEECTAERFLQSLQNTLNRWRLRSKQKQTLRIGVECVIVSLDPRIGGETASADVLKFLFEGLTRFNEHGQIENAMAEKIEVDPDMLHYTFHLRSVHWNDGSTLTAHDFEYAWKSILSPHFKSPFGYVFNCVKNAKKAKEGIVPLDEIGVKAVDDYTLKVDLEHPTPNFLRIIANPLFSPVHRIIDQKQPQWPYQAGSHYPCNGPFQLEMNFQGQGFQLVKNPNYWNSSQISLDQVNLTHMNSTQAAYAFQQKEIDWLGNPLGSWHSIYNQCVTKQGKIVSYPNALACWCVLNTSSPLFRSKKLRQALACAVDRSKITEGAFLPLNPAFSPLLPKHQGSKKSNFPSFNPEKASRLFHEALEELGLTKQDFQNLGITFHESGIREYTADCLKKQFAEVLEISCELRPQSWKETFRRMSQGDFEMGIMHWLPSDDLVHTLNSFRTQKQKEINFSQWENLDFEHYLSQYEKEVNPFVRSSYSMKAEELLAAEVPVIPLFYQSFMSLVNEDLMGFYNEPSSSFNLTRAFFRNKEYPNERSY